MWLEEDRGPVQGGALLVPTAAVAAIAAVAVAAVGAVVAVRLLCNCAQRRVRIVSPRNCVRIMTPWPGRS